MEKDNFKFNAFISYRHNDLDKYVAENLHRLIEIYKMPKPIVKKYNITDNNIRRVFRDQEELPLASNLENPIMEALMESKFLIVICSPRLKDSIWCKREIENFIKFHGRKNILCVLVEGEPKDSFPEELLYYEEKIKNKNGKEEIKRISCEPLAMDVRGNSKKEIYKKLKTELIRIIAPMYNLDYDDIKRRHEERKLKHKVRIFQIITIVSIIFAIYSAILFFKIYISSKQLKYNQAINLANSANELLLKDDRNGAIEKAYESVTKYNNIKMPRTSKGIYELTDSLGVYYDNIYYYPLSQLNTSGIVESIKTDADKNYLLSRDNSKELVLWNLNFEKKIRTIYDSATNYTFIGNKAIVYQNTDKDLVVLDLNGNEITKINLNFYIESIISSGNGKFFAIRTFNKMYIYDTNSYTEEVSYELARDKYMINEIYFDEKEENIILYVSDKLTNSNNLELQTYNIIKKEIINKTIIKSDKVIKLLFRDNNVIALTQRKIRFSFNMLIMSYNYKNGNINFEKEYEGKLPLDISMSDSNNTLLASSWGTSYLIDLNTGSQTTSFVIGENVCNSYSLVNSNIYILFTSTGNAFFINGAVNKTTNKYNDATVYKGVYNFNLSNYSEFLYTNNGILAYANNDNRIIIYGKFKNDDIKEIKYEEKKFDTLKSSEKEIIIEEYNFTKKNKISNIFYSNDKKLLFVSFLDNTLEIYNNESKELLHIIENAKNMQRVDTYLGKTENNEYLIKASYGDGYILNDEFELIAYVPNLYDYNDDKLVLKYESKYYEVKIYNEEEIINIAKDKINKD